MQAETNLELANSGALTGGALGSAKLPVKNTASHNTVVAQSDGKPAEAFRHARRLSSAGCASHFSTAASASVSGVPATANLRATVQAHQIPSRGGIACAR